MSVVSEEQLAVLVCLGVPVLGSTLSVTRQKPPLKKIIFWISVLPTVCELFLRVNYRSPLHFKDTNNHLFTMDAEEFCVRLTSSVNSSAVNEDYS